MYVGNQYSPIIKVLIKSGLANLLTKIHFYNFIMMPNPVSIFVRNFVVKFRTTFWRMLESVCGMSKVIHTDMDRIPIIARNEPGGTSIWNMLNWLDNIESGKF